jgi:glutathione S-transferase
LADHPWCVGDTYSLADIALGCALGYLDLRFPEIDWRTSYPNLALLAARLNERSAFVSTVPPAA